MRLKRATTASFEACEAPWTLRWTRGIAQIIDNLVGCSKEELVSTLSKPERKQLKQFAESGNG